MSERDQDEDTLETPDQVCAALQIRKTTFYELLKSKQLKAVKIGTLTRVARSERRRFQAGLPPFEPSCAA